MLKKFIQFFFLTFLFFSQTSLRAEVFSQKEQEEAFAFVLKEMFYQEKKPIPIPKVLNVLDIPYEKYAQQCDFCDNKRINWYSKKFNEIWILPTSDLSVLVHEFVHYIQVQYEKNDDDPSGQLEDQAIQIQNNFKKLKSVKN